MRIDMVNIAPPTSSNVVKADSNVFASAKPGDEVTAEVVSVQDGTVTLKTGDGKLTHATMLTDAPLSPGDMLTLEVSSRDGAKSTLKLVAINAQPLDVGTGGKPSLASVMAQQGVQLSSPQMQLLSSTAARMPTIPVEIIAFAIANGSELSAPALNALASFAQGAPPLSAELNTLEVALTTLAGDTAQPHESSVKAATVQDATAKSASTVAVTTDKIASPTINIDSALPLPQNSQASPLANVVTAFMGDTKAPAAPLLDASIVVQGENIAPPQSNDQGQAAVAENAHSLVQEEAILPAQGKASTSESPSGKVMAAVLEGPHMAEQPASTLAVTLTPDKAEALPSIQKLGMVFNKLFAFVEDTSSNDNAKQIRNALENQRDGLTALKNIASEIAGTRSSLTQRAGELADRAAVAQNLEAFSYYQIPYQQRGQNENAELYVFKRNKRAKHGDDLTALIALSTSSMGRVETLLQWEEHVLSLDMRVESKEVQGHISNSTDELNKSLKETGFIVRSLRVSILEKPTTPLNAHKLVNPEGHANCALDISV